MVNVLEFKLRIYYSILYVIKWWSTKKSWTTLIWLLQRLLLGLALKVIMSKILHTPSYRPCLKCRLWWSNSSDAGSGLFNGIWPSYFLLNSSFSLMLRRLAGLLRANFLNNGFVLPTLLKKRVKCTRGPLTCKRVLGCYLGSSTSKLHFWVYKLITWVT